MVSSPESLNWKPVVSAVSGCLATKELLSDSLNLPMKAKNICTLIARHPQSLVELAQKRNPP